MILKCAQQPPLPTHPRPQAVSTKPERKQNRKAELNCDNLKAKLYEVIADIETTEIAFNDN